FLRRALRARRGARWLRDGGRAARALFGRDRAARDDDAAAATARARRGAARARAPARARTSTPRRAAEEPPGLALAAFAVLGARLIYRARGGVHVARPARARAFGELAIARARARRRRGARASARAAASRRRRRRRRRARTLRASRAPGARARAPYADL